MDIKKIFLGALVAMASVSVSAQEQPQTVEEFNPHMYIQGQVGGQYTLGEIDFDKLLSPNAQIAVGYQFSPIFGARLAVNGWQSKGGSKFYGNEYKWKWNYVAPTADLTINLTNLFGGFKYNRVFNLGLFVGAGANFAWNNDEAREVRETVVNGVTVNGEQKVAPALPNTPEYMEYCDGWKHVRFVGQFGLTGDFRLCDALSLGLEFGCNLLSDTYNSKRAGNCDWYFNGLVGIRYNFGATHKTKVVPQPEPRIVEKVIEKYVERPAAAEAVKSAPVPPQKQEKMRRDIFFVIRGSDISTTEQPKVDEVVAYLKKYPNAKVSVTGYADKRTGNPRVNMKYSEARAKVVADYLKAQGINANRITVAAKGDTEQPFPDNNPLNRATICIAE